MRNLLISSLLLISFSAFSFHPPLLVDTNIVDGKSLKGDSGIYGPKFEVQVQDLKDLASLHSNAKYIHYGDTLKKRPLSAILFTPKDQDPTRFAIITGAIHGNEYLNIVDRLPKALLNSKKKSFENYLEKGGAVLFVPIVNPDGYEKRRRGNNKWADLNRDWPNPANNHRDFKQPESKNLAVWIDDYINNNKLKVDIAVDYHCCVDGTLLLPWGFKKGEHMGTMDAGRSKKIENMFRSSFNEVGGIGTPPDILYSAVGTTLDYWYDKYNAISFTYEGRSREEKQLLPNHVNWWNQIFDHL